VNGRPIIAQQFTAGFCQRRFTARAASKAITNKEISAWIIMRIFAQRESTGTSVGEKAVLVLNARNK
jgi:hypothetical protein